MLGSTVFDRNMKVTIPVITLRCYENMVSLAKMGKDIPYFNKELVPMNNRDFVRTYKISSFYKNLFHYFENESHNFIYDFGNDPIHEINFSFVDKDLIVNPRIFMDQKGYISALIIKYTKRLCKPSENEESINIKINFYKGKQILDIKSFMIENIASIPDLKELELYTRLYDKSKNVKFLENSNHQLLNL